MSVEEFEPFTVDEQLGRLSLPVGMLMSGNRETVQQGWAVLWRVCQEHGWAEPEHEQVTSLLAALEETGVSVHVRLLVACLALRDDWTVQDAVNLCTSPAPEATVTTLWRLNNP